MAQADDDSILAEMMLLADRLCASEDQLLKGQYAYLRSRIDALIVLRGAAAEAA